MEKTKRSFFRLSISPWGLLETGMLLCCLGTVTGFMGDLWPPFDLASHFRPQYFIFLVCAGVTALIGKKFQWWLPAFMFAMVNLAVILPYYLGHTSASGNDKTYTCITANLNSRNNNHVAACSFLNSTRPDFMTLMEVTPQWLLELQKKLTPHYPYSISKTRTDNFGIAMFSRIPFNNARIQIFGSMELPSIVAVLNLNGQSITVIGAHPPPPVGLELMYENKKFMKDVAHFIAKTQSPFIVIGDLNMTPWSLGLKQFLNRTGLKDSRKGFGILPTWPRRIPPFLIPIDHCLVSKDIKIRSVRTGPDIGSDHYPLIVEFAPDESLGR